MPPTKRLIKKIGYEWVVDPHNKHPCPRCRELNGRKYYKNPKSGQRGIKEIPPQPLHPKCRCKLELIYGYAWDLDPMDWLGRQPDPPATVEESGKDTPPKPVFSEDDTRGGINRLGVVLGNDGRPITSGPAYGYYGGRGWMKGTNVTDVPLNAIASKPSPDPKLLDVLDLTFKEHDDGYVSAEIVCNSGTNAASDVHRCRRELELEADRKLVAALEDIKENNLLEKDLDRLGRTPKQKEYAERFLRFAHWYFDGVVADADRKNDVAH